MSSLSDMLVPGRDCGGCTVCCSQLTIKTPELKKLPGVLCSNCKEGSGCQIYETRPPVCREWYCGWRVMPQLDDSWRPDQSEILITLDPRTMPGYSKPTVKVELIGSLKKILWLPLVNFIAAMIEAKVPLFLNVPGPPGHVAGSVFLTDNLAPVVASRDLERMMTELTKALEAGVRHQKEAINLDEDD